MPIDVEGGDTNETELKEDALEECNLNSKPQPPKKRDSSGSAKSNDSESATGPSRSVNRRRHNDTPVDIDEEEDCDKDDSKYGSIDKDMDVDDEKESTIEGMCRLDESLISAKANSLCRFKAFGIEGCFQCASKGQHQKGKRETSRIFHN